MKLPLELNLVEDGRVFLNFWDSCRGNDVVAEFKDSKLLIEGKEVSLNEYIELVKKSVSEW